MKCKNCGNNFEGKYCNSCGQNIRVDKLTLKNFIEELSESIFQINHGLFFTIKSLFLRPGHAIREFLEGQRKSYFKPIAYVLIIATFYYLITKIFETNNLVEDFMGGYNNAKEERLASAKETPVLSWLSNNFAYAILFLIPFFSIGTHLSFFNKSYNYLEHIVINFYITGQQILFYAFLTIIGVLLGKEDSMIMIAVILSMVFRFWTFIQIFEGDNGIKVFFRLIMAYLLFYVIFAILMMLTLIVNQ